MQLPFFAHHGLHLLNVMLEASPFLLNLLEPLLFFPLFLLLVNFTDFLPELVFVVLLILLQLNLNLLSPYLVF